MDKFHRIFDGRMGGEADREVGSENIAGNGGRGRIAASGAAGSRNGRANEGETLREITSTEGNLCNGLINPPPLCLAFQRKDFSPSPPLNEVALLVANSSKGFRVSTPPFSSSSLPLFFIIP